MTDNNTNPDNESIKRRKFLRASGFSVIGGAFAGTTVVGTGKAKQSNEYVPPRPDLQLVDNSDTRKPVTVDFYPYELDVLSEESTKRQEPADTISFNTTGLHYLKLSEKKSTEEKGAIEAAFETVEKLSIDQFDEMSLNSGPMRFEVVVEHDGKKDSTKISLGPTGLSKDETLDVSVRPNGSVTIDPVVNCR